MATRGLAAMLALSLASCSFMMKNNPSGWEPSHEPTCSGNGPPVIDTLLATVFIAAAIPSDDDDCEMFCNLNRVLAVPGLIYAISALVGFGQASQCSRSKQQHRAWLKENSLEQGCEAYLTEWNESEDDARRWLVLYDRMPAACRDEIADPRPSDGTAGGFCYRNQSCNRGKVCIDKICRPGPDQGAAGGECFPNCTCNPGLVCHRGTCQVAEEAAP